MGGCVYTGAFRKREPVAIMSSPRWPFVAQLLTCATLLGVGYYLQYVEFLDPCPLCIVQRLFFFTIGVLALVAVLHAPGRLFTRLYAAILALLTSAGAAVAGRQIWLQHSPDAQHLSCGAGLEVMLETLPFLEVVGKVLRGTGDCALVQWTFWGLSIPGWAILWFAAMLLVNLYLLCKRDR